jgi:hypothetical protein
MQIISYEGGRILDLVPLEEIRPLQGVILPDFFSAIHARYEFSSKPIDLVEAAKSGAKFELGKFVLEGNPLVVKELAIYNDGLICETYDTLTAELVLNDFIAWATTTFKLRERQSRMHRTYTSAFICKFDKEIESGLGKLDQIRKLLSKALNTAYGWEYDYNLNRLSFMVDPMAIPHLRNTNLVMERRLQFPYSENRYYCVAPLSTEAHIRLLEAIEGILS